MNLAEVVVVDDYYENKIAKKTLMEIFEGSGHSLINFLPSIPELREFLDNYSGETEKLVFWMDGDLKCDSTQQVNDGNGHLVDAPDDVRNLDGINGIKLIREKWPNSPPIIVGRAGKGEIMGADYQASKKALSNFAFVEFLSTL